MHRHIVCEAIRLRRLLSFVYHDRVRVVEPHLCGLTTADHDAVRAWLLPGYSTSGKGPGWRTYLLADMRQVQVLDEEFAGTRPRYNPRDRGMARIYCRLDQA